MLTYDNVRTGNVTSLERERLHKTRVQLQSWKSDRECIRQLLGTNERTARDVINSLGFVYPIAIEKTGTGKTLYFIASNKDHEGKNLHKIMDRLSRCEEMLHSILPNFNFERAVGQDWSELETAVRTFLKALGAPKIAQMLIQED